MKPACRCTSTTNPSSRSASTATRLIQRSLHDVITTIDNALTRPWTVDKKYVHNPNLRANWPEYYLSEGNAQIVIGKENYFLSWDGALMPAKKNQAPPDLKYFDQSRK